MKTSPGKWKPSSAAIHGSETSTTSDGEDEAPADPTGARRERRARASRGSGREPERRGRRRAQGSRSPSARRGRPGRRTNGIVAHSAIAGPATHHAAAGSAATAISASAIATSAIGKLTSVSARLRPPAMPVARDVVRLRGIDPAVGDEHDRRHEPAQRPGRDRLALPCAVGARSVSLLLVRRGAQRLRDVCLVVLVEPRVEGKRERARRGLLGDRAEPDAIPEALLHVRLEVDAGQVARGLHARSRERRDHRLAIGAGRERDDVDEPRALVLRVVLARKLETGYRRREARRSARRPQSEPRGSRRASRAGPARSRRRRRPGGS